MATSILLFLSLLPVQPPMERYAPDSRAGQAAFTTAPFEGPEPLCWVRAEAVDEEGEEEEFEGQQPAYHPFDEVSVDGLSLKGESI